MKKILLFTLLFSSCTKEISMNQCDVSKYYSSSKHSTESTFKNNQREIFTIFSLTDFQQFYRDTNMSCLDVLSNHFYCNFCFENTSILSVSYLNKKLFIFSISKFICSSVLNKFSYPFNSSPNSVCNSSK